MMPLAPQRMVLVALLLTVAAAWMIRPEWGGMVAGAAFLVGLWHCRR